MKTMVSREQVNVGASELYAEYRKDNGGPLPTWEEFTEEEREEWRIDFCESFDLEYA